MDHYTRFVNSLSDSEFERLCSAVDARTLKVAQTTNWEKLDEWWFTHANGYLINQIKTLPTKIQGVRILCQAMPKGVLSIKWAKNKVEKLRGEK